MSEHDEVVEGLLAGEHRALARAISIIENRAPGYRKLVSRCYSHTGGASVVGVTGSPGAGKSTLVDKLAEAYRERGETVGIIAIDPSSPFTGGAVLGDRIRMASAIGDMDVFIRSMSARGTLGGLSAATIDAVTAMDAFGKDRIIIETVGAGQNEVDIMRAAETVAVLVPPGSGDGVQTLKAGILEIADIFVVNKADREGADRTVSELREMLELGAGASAAGHHGVRTGNRSVTATQQDGEETAWQPPIVETVATSGEGVGSLLDSLAAHRQHLEQSGGDRQRARTRSAALLQTVLREDINALLEAELDAHGGLDALAAAIAAGEQDPYTVADTVLEPLEACLSDGRHREQDTD